ncbi:cobalamin-dependent protein [Hoeflea sp. AS60]|uniref:B12-binding domain-containing radical SAM protein n=1 Tax=Hoeflea sp. AS60 TaxID=3135780 RepID=UPI00317E18A4
MAQILLIVPPAVSHRTAEENLGVGYLASTLRAAGHQVDTIDAWLEGLSASDVVARVKQLDAPLWVGFSAYMTNISSCLETIEYLREAGIVGPYVAGGYGPTFNPTQFLDAGFDVVVRGEGEASALKITEFFDSGRDDLSEISNICFRAEGKLVETAREPLNTDLDKLPFPARDTMHLSLARRSAINIDSSRGCAARCLFCSIVAFQKLSQGPTWRQRTISHFVDELEQLYGRGARLFKVIDDSLIEPPRGVEWASRLADEIEARGLVLKLRGQIRAEYATDEVLRELRRAGFFSFSCGIENFSDTALFRMRKSARAKDNFSALDALKENGYIVQAGHILFDHGTTMKELHENYAAFLRYPWIVSKGIFTEMFAAEGTPYTRLVEHIGIASEAKGNLGNRTYTFLNKDIEVIYHGLKAWQKQMSMLYEKCVDPLSAPKLVSDTGFDSLLAIHRDFRRHDLDMFNELLGDIVATPEEAVEFAVDRARGLRNEYAKLSDRLDRTYSAEGLVYDAQPNPFLC